MVKYETPYIEQWNRIIRLRKALNSYEIATSDNFEDALDSFTSFIIQCYHLRDWLIKSGYDQKQIDDQIQNNTYLSLCRDLANTQKHQEIDRYKPRNSFVENDFGITTPISMAYNPLKRRSFFCVRVWEFGMPIDIIVVADGCLKAWKGIIDQKSHDL